MIYKTYNKCKPVSSQLTYDDFHKKLVKFISKGLNGISDFINSLFTSKPYVYEEYIPTNKRDNFKNSTDIYLATSRRTFL